MTSKIEGISAETVEDVAKSLKPYCASIDQTNESTERVFQRNRIEAAQKAITALLASGEVELKAKVGGSLPSGMEKISAMIANLQGIMDQFGDTCVYIKPGVSWGATAINQYANDQKSIEETAISFAEKFKPHHKESARQVMWEAISLGWVHRTSGEVVLRKDVEELVEALRFYATTSHISSDDMLNLQDSGIVVEQGNIARKAIVKFTTKQEEK